MKTIAKTSHFLLEVATIIVSTCAVTIPMHQESLTPDLSFIQETENQAVPAPTSLPVAHLRGQAATPSSALLETESDATENVLELGVNSDLAFLETLPHSNSTQNQALEDQVADLFKLSSLRNSMTKEQFAATPFGKSVDRIQHLIEGVMMVKVEEAHHANQKELFKLSDEVHKCGDTKNVQVGKANLKKALYLKFSPLHKTCRAGEAGEYTVKSTCWEEEADKKKVMDLECQKFEMVKKQVGDETSNRQIMKKGGSESHESYVNRIAATVCGNCVGAGCKLLDPKALEDEEEKDTKPGDENKKCGYDPYTCGCGFKCRFDKAKDSCDKATHEWHAEVHRCQVADHQYLEKRKACDSLQDQMDDSSCKRAVQMKDACESYEECHFDKKTAYLDLEKMVKSEESDRQAEWKGLKRMKCLIKAFATKKVTNKQVEDCKKAVHSVDHLVIEYPELRKLEKCEVPHLYPNTPSYKKVNFAPLPALAKGKEDSFECAGLKEISTEPKEGSPTSCKCSRVTLNGPYSPGPMVKCVNCLDVRRSLEKNSCPDGTKIFAPRSRTDWKTFLHSATPLAAPNFIIDITRPLNGCGGCHNHRTKYAMNSPQSKQYGGGWTTSDGTPWWLRATKLAEPNGDYFANCYMNLNMHNVKDESNITFNDHNCNYHSKSYYCQSQEVSLVPKAGSPNGCVCKLVALTGKYSAGSLVKCTGCLRVSKSTEKNSCPRGTKLFSPRTRQDWKTFIASAGPLRSPNWIIDVTQPQNGCGGCTRNAMNSRNPAQATWRTSDGTAWFLRGAKYSEPNGDYHANCYMDLGTTANEDSVTFSDGKCGYNSNAYYCQTAKMKKKPPPPAPPPPPPEPPTPKAGGKYKGFKCAAGIYTGVSPECDHFTGLSEAQCWEKCQNSSSAMGQKRCDEFTGLPDCVATVYNKRLKVCMLARACRTLTEWPGHKDIVTRIKPSYDPAAKVWHAEQQKKCKGKPYTTVKDKVFGLRKAPLDACLEICYASLPVKPKVPQKRCVAVQFLPLDRHRGGGGERRHEGAPPISLMSRANHTGFWQAPGGFSDDAMAGPMGGGPPMGPMGNCDFYDKCDEMENVTVSPVPCTCIPCGSTEAQKYKGGICGPATDDCSATKEGDGCYSSVSTGCDCATLLAPAEGHDIVTFKRVPRAVTGAEQGKDDKGGKEDEEDEEEED